VQEKLQRLDTKVTKVLDLFREWPGSIETSYAETISCYFSRASTI